MRGDGYILFVAEEGLLDLLRLLPERCDDTEDAMLENDAWDKGLLLDF